MDGYGMRMHKMKLGPLFLRKTKNVNCISLLFRKAATRGTNHRKWSRCLFICNILFDISKIHITETIIKLTLGDDPIHINGKSTRFAIPQKLLFGAKLHQQWNVCI